MFGCFKTLSVRISLLICKISQVKNGFKSYESNWEIDRGIYRRNLKGDVETSYTRLVDDFDSKWLARNSIRCVFNFCRVALSECPPKLVFTDTHSLCHHSIQIPEIIYQYKIGQRRVYKLWVCIWLCMFTYIYKDWGWGEEDKKWRLNLDWRKEHVTRHYPFASFFSLLLNFIILYIGFFFFFSINDISRINKYKRNYFF